MINETKLLLGGLDKDNSPESINQYDYIDAHNIRSIGVEGSDANYTTNLEGTKVIPTLLPAGQNKGVGGARFETVGKAYRVVYNSNGYHQILEFDFNRKQESIIFENKTDSNGEDILSIEPDTFFCDVKLIDKKYLILNDAVNPIYTIDVELFKASRTTPKTLDYLLLAKKPSLVPPKFTYESDNGRTSNNLRGNLFQFRTQFGYEDYRNSVWSTVSKRIVPENEPADGYGQNVQSYNCLRVVVSLGDLSVETLRVALRIGLGNWLLVKEKKISDIKKLTSTNVSIPSVQEAYNPSTNEYIFLFYNDGMYPIIDQIEVESNYDHIPHNAEAVEVINGNMLAVAGVTEGYDRPVVEDVNFTVASYNPNIINTIENNTNLFVNSIGNKEYLSSNLAFRTLATISLRGTPKTGDQITIKLAYRGKSIIVQTYEMTLTSTEEAGGLPAVYQFMASRLPRSNANNERVNFYTTDWLNTGDRDLQLEVRSVDIVQKNIGTVTTKSVGALKSQSSYQLALSYTDRFGKFFPIVTDDRFIIKTQSLAEAQGLLSQVTWELPEKAPEGAVSYQWLITENQTHQKWIYLTGTYDADSSDSTVLSFNMKSLARFFRNEKESQVTYSFTKGDKVTLYLMTDGNSSTPVKYFRFPFIDLDIVDFKVDVSETDPSDVSYFLKVRNTDLLNLSEITGKEILMELYTPRKRAIDTESLLFYEIGESYPIVDGKHSVRTGVIKEADNYVRGRLYESTITANTPLAYVIEDPNFSDNYVSNFYSFGRARTYNDEIGRITREASIRYSDEYKIGSRFNGINTFYSERIYGEAGGQTTSKYGAIKKLVMRDSSLVCIQSFKVGVIPVYKSIIFDNSDRQLIADTGRIFDSVQYRNGNYGCGNAKESIAVSRNLTIYMIDDNNCVPVRDSIGGIDVLDGNMTHYFIEHINNAKNLGAKFIGYYDDLYNEYNVTAQDRRGVLTQLKFNEAEFRDNFPIDYSKIQDLEADHGFVAVDTNTGQITYQPNLDYVGSDEIRFTYFGKLIKEKVEVLEPDTTPDQFYFEEAVYQLPNTIVVSNSIVVTGINEATRISVGNGEFSVNGGAWLNMDWLVEEGDTVRVRGMSSGTPNGLVSVTLDIGGTIGVFEITTTPSAAVENIYITHNIIEPSPQTGSTNQYGVKLTLSHALAENYQSKFHIVYPRFGSSTISTSSTCFIAQGSTEAQTGYFVTDADPVEGDVYGEIETSTLQNGDTVMCDDGEERIVVLYNPFYI